MSNLKLLSEKLQQQPFVCAVDILDETHNSWIGKNLHNSNFNPHSNLEAFLKDLYISKGVKRVKIQEKRKNGSSYKTTGNFFVFNLESNTQAPPPTTEAPSVIQPVQTPVAQPQQQMPNYAQNDYDPQMQMQPSLLGLFGRNGLNGGLNQAIDEITELKSVRYKLNLAEEELRKVKNETDDKIRKLNNEVDEFKKQLRIEEVKNSEFQSKLNTANVEKDLAVKMVEIQTKSFGDSEFAKKLPEMLTGIAKAYVMSKGGQGMPDDAQGLEGVNDLSDVKREVIETIASEVITDAFASELKEIIQLMYSNAQFTGQIRSVKNQYLQTH
jgi:ribosomal protein L11